jgi:hypothetical protein
MPRKLRVQYPGAIYYVMNRGDRRERIFKDNDDRHRKRGQGRTFAYRRELYRETCAYEGPLRGFRGGWNIFDIAGPFFTLPAWLASCVSNTQERFTT